MKKFFLILAISGLLSTTTFAHAVHYPDQTQDVQVKTQMIGDNLYLLQGRGGNIAAFVGMQGTLLVDDDYKQVSQKLSEALKAINSGSPKYILNTHWHGDHTEGNFFFGKDSTILAHVNVRKRLLDPPEILGQKTPAYPEFALPVITYNESMTLNFNGEEIRLVHFPNGHTDGDTVVFFTKANVVHMGDDFFAGKFPFVDIWSGGSVQGLINNVSALINQMPANAKIIPGHGNLATLDDLKTFHQMLVETSDIVTKQMKAKKTVDEIKKAGLPDKYKDWGTGFIKTDQWIDLIYQSYSKK